MVACSPSLRHVLRRNSPNRKIAKNPLRRVFCYHVVGSQSLRQNLFSALPMKKFLTDLKKFYKTHKRSSLPWRHTRDAYKILVSEIMLQQTQVDRVVPFYTKFIKKFPTARKLATASLSGALKEWQGLGYNRRAQFLHEAAKMIEGEYKGKFPTDVTEIEKLPGVGHYTSRAVAAFAYNAPEVFVETNIRTVFISRLNVEGGVSDKEVILLVEKALKQSKMPPRDFYAALMDYGSFLKKSGVRVNNKSVHYTKQSKFEGSTRQLRAAIVRELLKQPSTTTQLTKGLEKKQTAIERELQNLLKEKMIQKKAQKYFI